MVIVFYVAFLAMASLTNVRKSRIHEPQLKPFSLKLISTLANQDIVSVFLVQHSV